MSVCAIDEISSLSTRARLPQHSARPQPHLRQARSDRLLFPALAAFDENLTHYKVEIPQLFRFNALLIASNGTDSRVGSLTAD